MNRLEEKHILIILDRGPKFNIYKEKIWNSFDRKYREKNIFTFLKSDEIEKIEQAFLVTDIVFNFANPNFDNYRIIQERIEFLKLNYWGNDLATNIILNLKNNFKKIAEQNGFKTPVFDKIGKRSLTQLFQDVVLPTRIYSKDNDFYSGKLESLEEIKNVYNSQKNIENYYVEEYIEGEEYYFFVSIDIFDEELEISIYKKDNKDKDKLKEIDYLDLDLKFKEFTDKLLKFSKKIEINSFALYDVIYSKKRGFYILNIFISNLDILEKDVIFTQVR